MRDDTARDGLSQGREVLRRTDVRGEMGGQACAARQSVTRRESTVFRSVISYFARGRLLRYLRAWTCSLQQDPMPAAAAQGQEDKEENLRTGRGDTQAAQQRVSDQAEELANTCIGVDEMFMSSGPWGAGRDSNNNNISSSSSSSSSSSNTNNSTHCRTLSASIQHLASSQPYAWQPQKRPQHQHAYLPQRSQYPHAYFLQPAVSSGGIPCMEYAYTQYVPPAPAPAIPARTDGSLVFGLAEGRSGEVAREETAMTPNGSIKQVNPGNRNVFPDTFRLPTRPLQIPAAPNPQMSWTPPLCFGVQQQQCCNGAGAQEVAGIGVDERIMVQAHGAIAQTYRQGMNANMRLSSWATESSMRQMPRMSFGSSMRQMPRMSFGRDVQRQSWYEASVAPSMVGRSACMSGATTLRC